MKYTLILAAVLSGIASQALAANCVSPLTGNDAGGTSRNFGVTIDASNNCYGNVALVDGTNAANKVAVKAASTAPAATDPALVVSLSQNAGLGAAATPMQVSLANTGANATAVKVDPSGVTSPVSGTVTANAGTNLNTSALATSANQTTELASLASIVTNTGAAWPSGTNMGGFVGLQANTTGGCTPGVILTAASNNSTSIKAAAGTLCELTFLNTTTGIFDVRLYDTASAPTCSSATGVVGNYVAQSNATSPGFAIPLGPFGKAFTTGIGVCITGANANNDNTNAATGGNFNYAFK